MFLRKVGRFVTNWSSEGLTTGKSRGRWCIPFRPGFRYRQGGLEERVGEGFSSAVSECAPGSQMAGYRVEEQIGRGGMAVVYRAYDPRLDRHVALKILAPSLADDGAFRQRFIRESRAAAAVDHPHIIPVFDAGEANGVLFIAMRFVGGADVRTLLDTEGPLPARRAGAIAGPGA